MTSCGSVLAWPELHIPPPRLLPSCSVGRPLDSSDKRIWHLYSPESPAIINKIMSRSTVRYLILSNGKKSPPTYANAVFAAPVGRDTTCVPRSSELEKSEWVQKVADVFPVNIRELAEKALKMHPPTRMWDCAAYSSKRISLWPEQGSNTTGVDRLKTNPTLRFKPLCHWNTLFRMALWPNAV